MRLFDNPILRTQARLAMRRGFWPVVLVAAVLGFAMSINLLSELGADFATPESIRRTGEGGFYAIVMLQGLVLIGGTGLRVIGIIDRERSSGLLDSMRTTPLSTSKLLFGYVGGGLLLPLAAYLCLLPFALLNFGFSGLPYTHWVVAEGLMVTTALLTGLGTLCLSLFLAKRASLPVFLMSGLGAFLLGGGSEHVSVLSLVFPATTMAALLGHHEYDSALVHQAYESANLAVPTWAISLALQLLLAGVLVSFALRSLRPRLDYRSLAAHLGAGLFVLMLFQALHSTVIGAAMRTPELEIGYRGYMPSEAALGLLPAVSAGILTFALGWACSPRGLPGAPTFTRSYVLPMFGATVSACVLLVGFAAGAFPNLVDAPAGIVAGVFGVFSITLLADAVAIWAFAPHMPGRRVMLPLTIVSMIFIPIFLGMTLRDEVPVALLPLGPNLVAPSLLSWRDGASADVLMVVITQFIGYGAFSLVTRRVSQSVRRPAL